MKALGMTLLDRILHMSKTGTITEDERVEFARIIQAAMLPHHEQFYQILRDKLKEKERKASSRLSDEEYDYLFETISLIQQKN